MKKDEIYYNPPGSPVVPSKFDTRVQLRFRSRGLVTADELKKHLTSLPDEAAAGEFVDYEAIVSDEREAGSSGGNEN